MVSKRQKRKTQEGEGFIPSEVTVVPPPLKDLMVWKAAARPFKRRDKEYFSTIAAIVFLVVVILFFVKEYMAIVVVVALMFVSYVLATIPPESVEYKITTRGIMVSEKMYKWEVMYRFWFIKKWGTRVLNVDTFLPMASRLQIVIPESKRNEIKELMEKRIMMEKPEETFLDKSSKWLQKKVPLESSSK